MVKIYEISVLSVSGLISAVDQPFGGESAEDDFFMGDVVDVIAVFAADEDIRF